MKGFTRFRLSLVGGGRALGGHPATAETLEGMRVKFAAPVTVADVAARRSTSAT